MTKRPNKTAATGAPTTPTSGVAAAPDKRDIDERVTALELRVFGFNPNAPGEKNVRRPADEADQD